MATIPRFDIPSQMNKPGPWVMQPINASSDGDPSKWGAHPYRAISNDSYRVKIGSMWAEQKGTATLGINYYLDRLPNGYQLMDYPKGGDESVRYKRLFGHPCGRFFDSQLKFFPHFLWLMNGMKETCECVLCNKDKKQEPKSKPAATFKPRPRVPKEMGNRNNTAVLGKRAKPVTNYFDRKLYEQRGQRTTRLVEPLLPTDEEGTLDIYKDLVQVLYRHRQSNKFITENIEEKSSMDWRAEHNDKYGQTNKILSSHLTYVLLQHSFVPRIGELVLWCMHHPDDVDIVYNPKVGGYQFYSPERRQFHGFPRWRGGVVTERPSIDEGIDFPDVLCVVNRKDSLNRAGFRVETFPDPNDDIDKSASKQFKYIPLRQIRPLSQWQTILRGIPEKKLEPSIQYALTCTVSVSLVEKYRFTGRWPDASIFCKGIYLGAELLIQGDAVKLIPSHKDGSTDLSKCTDVLVISDIRLNLLDIDEEHTINSSRLLGKRSSITLVGKAYTLDPTRDYTQTSTTSPFKVRPQPIPAQTIKHALPTVGAAAYGEWYALHAPDKKYEINFNQVLGRLYESGAMGMWSGMLGNRQTCHMRPSLSSDLASVLAARQYGTLTDSRIPEVPSGTIKWHWGDTRVNALSLETVNGIEVGVYHKIRDLRTMQAWRARIKIIDGISTSDDLKDSMLAKQKGRLRGSRMVGNVLVGPDEQSESEETDPPARGSFSEAVRSQRGAGGMVGAGAALEEDDDEEDRRPGEAFGDDEIEEEEPSMNASKVNIMAQEIDWTSSGFFVPEDPDVEMRPPPLPSKRSTSTFSPDRTGPTKARKSTGGSKISSIHAGQYDSSITPAMEQEMGGTRWKGKGRADTANPEWDLDTTFRSVEPQNSIPLPDDDDDEDDRPQDTDAENESNEEEEEDFLAPTNFVEPDPKDDDDYDDDDDDEDDDEDGREAEADEDEDDDGVEVSDEEKERIRTLANFQKHTFDRAGKQITF